MQARGARPRSTLRRPLGGHLSDRQLALFRSMLEEQRDFRLDQLAALRRPQVRHRFGGGSTEISLVLTVGARNALNEVLAALHRMDEGTYGRCVRCGATIGTERLEVLPQTPICMGCQKVGSE